MSLGPGATAIKRACKCVLPAINVCISINVHIPYAACVYIGKLACYEWGVVISYMTVALGE